MTRKVTIDPITRLEGHGKISICLDDAGARLGARRDLCPAGAGAGGKMRGRDESNGHSPEPGSCKECLQKRRRR